MPPSPEPRRDLLSAAALAFVVALYLVAGRRYPLDTLATPGPGVFPLAVGLFTLGLAVWQIILSARSRNPGRRDAPGARAAQQEGARPAAVTFEAGVSRHLLMAMIGTLIAYAIAIPVLGFLAASFVLVLVASWLLGERDGLRLALLALGVTAAAYAVFVTWLGVPLPRGLLR